VLADDLDVHGRVEQVVARREQLGADRHREQAGRAEVDDHADQVLDPDHLVVQGEPEVLGQAVTDRLGLFLGLHPDRLADHLAEQVVEHAEPDQPADDRESVAEHDRPVAGVGQREVRVLGGHVARLQEVAKQVPEQVADYRPDDRGVDRGTHPPRPPTRAGRLAAAGSVRLFRLCLDGHAVTSS